MDDIIINNKFLLIPRGTPGLPKINLDMTEIYQAEERLKEIRIVNQETSVSLMAYFNDVCNLTTKYLAWVKYEILSAQKYYEMAKATVILDKAPAAFQAKYKESGIKYNEDFRNAMIAQDAECQQLLDTINYLKAVEALLESKAVSFSRAHYTAKAAAEKKDLVAPSPNLSDSIGQLSEVSADFLGRSKHG